MTLLVSKLHRLAFQQIPPPKEEGPKGNLTCLLSIKSTADPQAFSTLANQRGSQQTI